MTSKVGHSGTLLLAAIGAALTGCMQTTTRSEQFSKRVDFGNLRISLFENWSCNISTNLAVCKSNRSSTTMTVSRLTDQAVIRDCHAENWGALNPAYFGNSRTAGMIRTPKGLTVLYSEVASIHKTTELHGILVARDECFSVTALYDPDQTTIDGTQANSILSNIETLINLESGNQRSGSMTSFYHDGLTTFAGGTNLPHH